MHLIIEKTDGSIFIYRESDKHNKKVSSKRNHLKKLDVTQMDIECNTDLWPDNSYVDTFYRRGRNHIDHNVKNDL